MSDPIDPTRVREAVERLRLYFTTSEGVDNDVALLCTAALDSLTQREIVENRDAEIEITRKAAGDEINRQRDLVREQSEAMGAQEAQHRADLVRLCELDAENREKISAAVRRAKEHRRQLRQMNKAIERYAAMFREQVLRSASEREAAHARAINADREYGRLIDNTAAERDQLRSELEAAGAALVTAKLHDEARKFAQRQLEGELEAARAENATLREQNIEMNDGNVRYERELEAARAERDHNAETVRRYRDEVKRMAVENYEALSTAQADAEGLRERVAELETDAVSQLQQRRKREAELLDLAEKFETALQQLAEWPCHGIDDVYGARDFARAALEAGGEQS